MEARFTTKSIRRGAHVSSPVNVKRTTTQWHQLRRSRTLRAAEQCTADPSVLSTEFSSDDEVELSWSFNDEGVMAWDAAQHGKHQRVTAPPNARPILLLPGFGNCTSDYEAPFGQADGSIANNLRARGFRVSVLDLERKDWFKVARALFTIRFWSSSLTTHPGYTCTEVVGGYSFGTVTTQTVLAERYLDRVGEAVEKLRQETGSEQIDLIGHSAGGWLGRAFIADPKYQQQQQQQQTAGSSSGSIPNAVPHSAVRTLITLGTPQRPPPPELVRDMTGGAQGWVHATYPGAYFKDQGVNYICCCGVAVKGQRDIGPDGKPVQIKGRPRLAREYAHDSYYQVCGQGQGIEGDAVVPLGSAYLAGAQHVILPGVWHSVSKIGTFEEESGVLWYGSDRVIDAWLGPYVRHAYDQQ